MNVSPLVFTREAGTSPATRRGLFRRPSFAHVLIALAVILAFVFNFLALQDRSRTRLVAVAESVLLAGSVISAEDIRFVPVDAEFEGLAALVDEKSWAGLEGWVVTRSIAPGAPVDISSLSAPSVRSGYRQMSVPIAAEHAAGGLLDVGDVVDVISVAEDGPIYVATGLLVVSLPALDSSGIGSFGGYHVVLAVTADQALLLAGAMDSGSVEIVLSTGANPIDAGSSDGT